MPIKPTVPQAVFRLRLDADLPVADIGDAIEQAHTQAVTYLDGALYETVDAMAQALDVRGIVCTPDIIAAQLLLVDVLIGANSVQDREAKETAARSMLRPHRNMGA